MKKTILNFVFALLTFSIFAQNPNLGFNQEPGKCYAKCLMPDQWESQVEVYPVFIGDADSGIETETIIVETKPQTTEWVKKRADKRCISNNPDDCLVWCLVESPAEAVELTIVKDTSQADFFVWETISIEHKEQAGGFTEWKEVVCKNKLSKSLVKEIQQNLLDEGYDVPTINGKYNAKTRAALTSFQRDYGLPVGHLDMDTLKKLGVHYRG